MEYTGNFEADAQEEVSEILSAIKREKKERRDKYRLLVDPEFWFCVCFQSRQQKEEFLEKSGFGGVGGDKYLDGLKLAEALGVEINPVNLETKPPPLAPKLLRGRPNIKKKGGDD